MEQHVLVTLTGTDETGITAAMLAELGETDAELLDIKQTCLERFVTIHLLLRMPKHHNKGGPPVLQRLLFRARDLRIHLDFRILEGDFTSKLQGAAGRFAITIIADQIDASTLGHFAKLLSDHDANIEAIRRLSQGKLGSVEFLVQLPASSCAPAQLRSALLDGTRSGAIDIAIQPESLLRRSKRLVVMDMDSTLIQAEVIDELATLAGVGEQVAAVTREAMHGNFPFDESLRRRAAMLKGLRYEKVGPMVDKLPLTQGAERLICVLKHLGFKTAVVSGGFECATSVFRERLGLDYAFANHLEVVDGIITGKVVEPIVGPKRKAEILRELAKKEGIPLAQTIAIGDGANDLDMLEQAGLGIAFHAKPKLKAAADTSISAGGLDRILYLLGITRSEIEEVLVQAYGKGGGML